MRILCAAFCALLVAGVALAVSPSTDVYLPSVGHARGKCVEGICSEWRTALWVYNPSTTQTASVTIYFLERNKDNSSPVSQTISVAPGETKEYAEVMDVPLGVTGKYGAIRVSSDIDVVVTGRIFDSNVPNSVGTIGTTGQFFAGFPADLAVGNGESTDLIGLAQDASGSTGTWRSNFGFVETTGQTCSVNVDVLDSTGASIGTTKSYTLLAREQKQDSVTVLGGTYGLNQRVRISVTSGSGKVIAFGSRLDNRSADPSTVEMSAMMAKPNSTGLFDGIVLTSDGLLIDGGIEVGISSSGLTGFSGVAGLPCGTESYVVDFSATATTPIPLGTDGSFTSQVSIPYSDGSSTVFTSNWTLSGTLATDGSMSGTLQSETTGGSGSWVSCNGTVSRPWRAGWAKNP